MKGSSHWKPPPPSPALFCSSDTLVILDGTDGELDLVSDCENCCRPINVKATVEGGQVVGVEAG
ncbi:MAG: CPXCG motif-containing cysteine-rich protein [Opitutae bacterium]|nr:CPXCG motif-containing cysteine-rich protein [Opitutae bacterium]